MAKSENQKMKMLYLVDKFNKDTDEQHGVTINDLITFLNSNDISAERKSLYNDIEILNKYGLDIIKEKSGGSTYYKLVSRDFELAELKLLVDSVQSSRFITTSKTNELIKKLESLASNYEAKQLQRQVYVVNRVKTMNEKIYFAIDIIHKAIYSDVQISFKYTAWNVKKQLVPKHEGKLYTASPWALAWEDENYYLIAYDDEEKKIKHYRVDKMMECKELAEKRLGKDLFDNFDMARYSNMTFGMFGGEVQNVKLEFSDDMVGVFIDRFGKDILIHPTKDEDRVYVNVDVAISGQFFGWLVGLGSKVKIVQPENVVNQFKDYIKNIIGNY